MTETILARLTIVVPTHNRYDRLCRALRYYSASGCRAPLVILDSSREGSADGAVRAALSAIDAKVSMARYQPETPPLAKIREGLQGVATPYVVLWADDDFLVPGALEEGVRILAHRPEVSAVHGASGLFGVRDGSLQWVAPYPQRAIMDETASARLLNHLGRYSVMFYSIQRTEALKYQFDRVCGLGLDWHTWGEIALGALAVIQGKAYAMPRLYMVREGHEGMGSALAQRARGLDPFDWLTDTAFARECGSYDMFREVLVPELMRQDGLEITEAREVVKRAFWSYLSQVLVKKWGGLQRLRGATSRARLREAAKRIPGLRDAWRGVRSRLPDQDAAMSLEALLRPRSRYHQDFMPIYRAIMEGNGREEVVSLAYAGVSDAHTG